MSQGTLESTGIFQNNIYPKNNVIITISSDHVTAKVNCTLSAARLLSVNTVHTQISGYPLTLR